ncbi:MAG: OB-fold nucleic acid binding domain-containing protein [Halobacteria archaeon]|nr:OB-fold nucleic acid binding domain-containing protein [Halobacteria archaeon]
MDSGSGEGDKAVSDVYSRLDADVSREEFEGFVEKKVEQMGGLCDVPTAAKLVAHEMNGSVTDSVEDITTEMSEVKFTAKVVDIGDVRSFERDDGDDGKVANIEVGDETGRVRVALWDEYADSIDELSVGDVLKIGGSPREGYRGGVEVSATEVEPDDETDVDVIDTATSVGDLTEGMSEVEIVAEVIETSGVRTFDRDEGEEGRVSNLVVGDDTDWIRLTLWDGRADDVKRLTEGDVVRVKGGYTRVDDGDLELHVGDRGTVEKTDDDVEFVPDSTPIEDVEIDETYDIDGVVTDVEETRTFTRDDGSEGSVRNIRVSDPSGEMRIALWGEKADIQLRPGDEISLTSVYVKEGWNDGVEGSVNWNSTVTVDGNGSPREENAETHEEGLDSFT